MSGVNGMIVQLLVEEDPKKELEYVITLNLPTEGIIAMLMDHQAYIPNCAINPLVQVIYIKQNTTKN